MGFLLFIVAIVLTAIVFACSLIFTPLYFIFTGQFKAGLKRFNGYWRQLAISIDQFGNGACGKFFQATTVQRRFRKVCYNFGNIDETVSFCLGQNKHYGYLNKFGLFLCKVLHLIERNHVEIAIEVQKEHDKKAGERYNSDNYALKNGESN